MRDTYTPPADVLRAGIMLRLSTEQRVVLEGVAAELGHDADIRTILGAFVSRVGHAEYQLAHPAESRASRAWHFPLDNGNTHVFANINTHETESGEAVRDVRLAVVQQGELRDDRDYADTYKLFGGFVLRAIHPPLSDAPVWDQDPAE